MSKGVTKTMLDDEYLKPLIVIAALIAVVCLGWSVFSKPACAAGPCPSYQCTSSSQCITCGCAIKVGETWGRCY